MQTITVNVDNDSLADKVTWFLKHLEKDGLEIVSREDFEDLKLLKSSRNEESIDFNDFIKNED